MYDYSPIGKIPLQTSANGSEELTGHFAKENELFIPRIWIYLCVNRRSFNKKKETGKIMYRNCSKRQTNWRKLDLNVILESGFGQNQMEYLGFWVTHNGVKPID